MLGPGDETYLRQLEKVPLFSGITMDRLKQLSLLFEYHSVSADDILFDPEDPDTGEAGEFYIVIAGRYKFTKQV